MIGHAAGATELPGVGKAPTHLVTRSAECCVKAKEKHGWEDWVFLNTLKAGEEGVGKEGRARGGDR